MTTAERRPGAAVSGLETIVAACLQLLRLRVVVYLAVVGLFLVALARGEGLPIHGNIHDTFIWLNAALFIDSGLRPHVDFSSPLGPLYLHANHLAWLATSAVGDMPLIVGFGTAAGFLVLAVLYRGYLRPWLVADMLMLVFVLAVCGRQMGHVAIDLTWYGTYSRYCWIAVLLLAIVLLSRGEALLKPDAADRLRIALLTGVLLTFVLLIKINFVVSIGIIYFAWMVASGAIRDLRVWVVPAAIVAAFVGAAALAGVSLDGYLRDILSAGEARRSEAASSLLRIEYPISLVVFLVFNFVFDRLFPPADGRTGSRTILSVGLAAGLFVGVVGDYARPFEVFAIVFAVRVLDRIADIYPRAVREPLAILPMTVAPVAVGAVFLIVEIYAVSLVSIYRLAGAPTSRLDEVSWSSPPPEPRRMHLFTSNESDKFIGGFPVIAAIMEPSPDRDRMMRALSATSTAIVHFTNKSYVPQVEEGVAVLRGIDGLANARVFPLTFSNPFPFLLGTRPPDKTPLWIHDGTTFNGDDPTFLDPLLAGSDIILVPHLSIDFLMRIRLKAMFEAFNARTRMFCEFHTGLYWSYYRRCRS